jgi:hypothetical protein
MFESFEDISVVESVEEILEKDDNITLVSVVELEKSDRGRICTEEDEDETELDVNFNS